MTSEFDTNVSGAPKHSSKSYIIFNILCSCICLTIIPIAMLPVIIVLILLISSFFFLDYTIGIIINVITIILGIPSFILSMIMVCAIIVCVIILCSRVWKQFDAYSV